MCDILDIVKCFFTFFQYGKYIKMYKENLAFFFDFDGVLADSTEIKTNTYKELINSYSPEVKTIIFMIHQSCILAGRISKCNFKTPKFLLASEMTSPFVADQASGHKLSTKPRRHKYCHVSLPPVHVVQ